MAADHISDSVIKVCILIDDCKVVKTQFSSNKTQNRPLCSDKNCLFRGLSLRQKVINCPLESLANTYNVLVCPLGFWWATPNKQSIRLIQCLLAAVPQMSSACLNEHDTYIIKFCKPVFICCYYSLSFFILRLTIATRGGRANCRVAVKLCKCVAKAGTQRGHRVQRAGKKKNASVFKINLHRPSAAT